MPTHIYKNPESYSKNNNLQYNFALSVLSQVKINPNDRVLDLGCGDGRITLDIAKLATEGSVIGADISEKMIEFASKNYNYQDNLRFITMDTSKNIFRNQFDLITSFNSLHWVKDQESALKGIAKAASDNAKVVLLLSHKKSSYHLAIDEICRSKSWSYIFKDYSNPRSFFTFEQYSSLLKESGLTILSLKEKELVYEFHSIDELKAFFASSMANIQKIPPNQKADFLEDFCSEFFKQSGCKDIKKIPVGFWCLEVFALKQSLECKDTYKQVVSDEVKLRL